MTSVQNVG